MGGASFAVGTFAHSLRVQLWREHLGMLPLGDAKQVTIFTTTVL